MQWWTAGLFILGAIIVFLKQVKFSPGQKETEKKPGGNTEKWKGFRWFQENVLNEHAMNYIIGIIATIVGVTLAIDVTNYDVHKNEKADVKSMLETVYRDVWEARAEKNIPFVNHEDDPDSLLAFFDRFVLRIPYTAELLVANEIANRVIPSIGLIKLQDVVFGLKGSSERIGTYDITQYDELLSERVTLDVYYERLIRFIYITYEYLQGNIGESELEIAYSIAGELGLIRLYRRIVDDDTAFESIARATASMYYTALDVGGRKEELAQKIKKPPYLSLDIGIFSVVEINRYILMDIDLSYFEEDGYTLVY